MVGMTRYLPLIEQLDETTTWLRIREEGSGALLSRAEVQDLWKSDETFCAAFSRYLADMPLNAFFWETPPLTTATLRHPFECVMVSAPALGRQLPDPRPFARQFAAHPASEVVAFSNLNGDADLVAPRRLEDGVDYGHLASFLRTAPQSQIREVWRLVSEAADPWLASGEPVWISTSGLGVAWLHVRLDLRPKYYSHARYRPPPLGR